MTEVSIHFFNDPTVDQTNIEPAFWEKESVGHTIGAVSLALSATAGLGVLASRMKPLSALISQRPLFAGLGAVYFVAAIYFLGGTYYKDPEVRERYHNQLLNQEVSLYSFVHKHGIDNLYQYGLALSPEHSPIFTKQDLVQWESAEDFFAVYYQLIDADPSMQIEGKTIEDYLISQLSKGQKDLIMDHILQNYVSAYGKDLRAFDRLIQEKLGIPFTVFQDELIERMAGTSKNLMNYLPVLHRFEIQGYPVSYDRISSSTKKELAQHVFAYSMTTDPNSIHLLRTFLNQMQLDQAVLAQSFKEALSTDENITLFLGVIFVKTQLGSNERPVSLIGQLLVDDFFPSHIVEEGIVHLFQSAPHRVVDLVLMLQVFEKAGLCKSSAMQNMIKKAAKLNVDKQLATIFRANQTPVAGSGSFFGSSYMGGSIYTHTFTSHSNRCYLTGYVSAYSAEITVSNGLFLSGTVDSSYLKVRGDTFVDGKNATISGTDIKLDNLVVLEKGSLNITDTKVVQLASLHLQGGRIYVSPKTLYKIGNTQIPGSQLQLLLSRIGNEGSITKDSLEQYKQWSIEVAKAFA